MPDNDRPLRLLAVSHEGSQTGAPMVLASLLEWLRANSDVSIHTLLVEDGPLRPRFEAVGSVSAVSDLPGAQSLGLLERGLVYRGSLRARRAPATLRYRGALAPLGRFDLVYLNSLTSLEIMPHLRRSPRVVAHVHEGSTTIGGWCRSQGPLASRCRPDRWVAVSDDCAAGLREHLGAAPTSIAVHHPFIDVDAVRDRSRDPIRLAQLRRSLQIPHDAAIVVGSGSIDRRKGPDLFAQVANEVRRRRAADERPVHFLWVGGDLGGPDWMLLRADLLRAGADHVHVTGHVTDPIPYFQLADVFALTSREDPFPLVCLEHAALGVPVVAYDSSGIERLLTSAGPDVAAGVIGYLDAGAMAERIGQLLSSPEEARQVGEALAASVARRHDAKAALPALVGDLGLTSLAP